MQTADRRSSVGRSRDSSRQQTSRASFCSRLLLHYCFSTAVPTYTAASAAAEHAAAAGVVDFSSS